MGDLAAVGTAFDLPRLAGKQQSKKFRNPDALANAQEELKKFRRACLTPHEHNLSLEASEDDRETALCHRKYESLEQKYLHYLTEPLRDDNGWLEEWTQIEASQVVDRVMQIEKEFPWALKRLGLIPGSQRIPAIDSVVQAFFADDVAVASGQAPP